MSYLILLPWFILLVVIIILPWFRKKETKPQNMERSENKSYETNVRLVDEHGNPLIFYEMRVLFKKMSPDGYHIVDQEEFTGKTNHQGIACFKHRVVGFGCLFLDFAHNKVEFSAPNNISLALNPNQKRLQNQSVRIL